jgi:hypothetical protein
VAAPLAANPRHLGARLFPNPSSRAPNGRRQRTRGWSSNPSKRLHPASWSSRNSSSKRITTIRPRDSAESFFRGGGKRWVAGMRWGCAGTPLTMKSSSGRGASQHEIEHLIRHFDPQFTDMIRRGRSESVAGEVLSRALGHRRLSYRRVLPGWSKWPPPQPPPRVVPEQGAQLGPEIGHRRLLGQRLQCKSAPSVLRSPCASSHRHDPLRWQRNGRIDLVMAAIVRNTEAIRDQSRSYCCCW